METQHRGADLQKESKVCPGCLEICLTACPVHPLCLPEHFRQRERDLRSHHLTRQFRAANAAIIHEPFMQLQIYHRYKQSQISDRTLAEMSALCSHVPRSGAALISAHQSVAPGRIGGDHVRPLSRSPLRARPVRQLHQFTQARIPHIPAS